MIINKPEKKHQTFFNYRKAIETIETLAVRVIEKFNKQKKYYTVVTRPIIPFIIIHNRVFIRPKMEGGTVVKQNIQFLKI